MRIWRRVAVVVALAMMSVLPTGVSSLGAQEGTLTEGSGPLMWTGGPFDLSYPLFCTSRYDPFCDHFDLTVELPQRTVIQVAVAADVEEEEYRVSVHGPDGSPVAQSTWGDSVAVNFHHRPFAVEGPYEVRVQPVNVESGSTYQGMIQVSPTLADPKADCTELIPDDIGVRGVTDDGSVMPLRVAVLVDQLDSRNRIRAIPEETYRTIFEEAEYSFEPLGVDLQVSFEEVLFQVEAPGGSTETSEVFAMAKDHFGGVRPPGSDVVYVLTQKNLAAGGSTSVAGQADCIGGIEDPRRAFGVGQNMQSGAPGGLVRFNMYAAAKIAAHEIGHLLGAHHHYANCAESLPEELAEGGLGVCTLMAPDLTLLTRKVGVLNSAIMRENVHVHAGHDH